MLCYHVDIQRTKNNKYNNILVDGGLKQGSVIYYIFIVLFSNNSFDIGYISGTVSDSWAMALLDRMNGKRVEVW